MAEPKTETGDPLSPTSAFEDTNSALDKLLAGLDSEKPEETTETPSEETTEETTTEETTTEETTEETTTEETTEEATTEETTEETPEAGDKVPREDGAPPVTEEKTEEKTEGEASEFDKKIDAIALPPHARPKSGEAFATVKTLAKEEVKKAQAELEAARKRIAELEPNVGKLDEATQKELEELRAYRATTDIEKAPEAVKAREAVGTVEQQVLDTLKDNGLNEEGLAHIKSLGGIQNVDWKPIFEKLPEKTVDFLKYKLAEHQAKLVDQRTVVESLKSKAGEFLKAREEQQQQATQQAEATRQEAAESILRELPFAQIQEIPADAKPEDRKRIEQENAIAKELRDRVKYGLSDVSPEMHGTLAVSAALAFRYNAQNKAWRKAYADLEKQHQATVAELEKIRNARKGKRESTPSVNTPPAKKGGKFQIGVSTDEALDALLAEATSQQD